MVRRILAGIVSLAALVGASFSAVSTSDFVAHLDRQVHGIHCSFLPGLSAPDLSGTSGCHVTLMSPYSSVYREWVWGGIPISLLSLAVFAYLVAYPLVMMLTGREGDRRAVGFLVAATLLPVGASLVMGWIALTELDAACRLCIGVYLSSFAGFLASIGLFVMAESEPPRADDSALTISHDELRERLGVPKIRVRGAEPEHVESTVKEDPSAHSLGVADTVEATPSALSPRPLAVSSVMEAEFDSRAPRQGSPSRWEMRGAKVEPTPWWVLGLAFGVGLLSVLISVLSYAANAPDFSRFLGACGTLEHPELDVAIPLGPQDRAHRVLEVLDPLCPACRGLEQRFSHSSFADRVSRKGVLFPIDHECNWMVPEALHPGACMVSEAILCGRGDGDEVLEWAFQNQSRIREVITANEGSTRALASMIRERFPSIASCLGSAEVRAKLNRSLRWAVSNQLPVLTPQLYIDETRVCDADTDLGLDWVVSRLLGRAP